MTKIKNITQSVTTFSRLTSYRQNNKMEALAIIGLFGSIVTLIFFFFTTRHKERMALIESGKDASIFEKKQLTASSSLKYGILLLSAGLGVVLGLFLSESFNVDEAVILPCVMICGGLGLITYYKIMTDKIERDDSNKEVV